MATDVDKAPELEKFVAEKKLKLGVVRVPEVYKLLDAKGYPTAWALDVDGRCIWRGHPQGLTDALAEAWLKDLRAPRIPRKLAPGAAMAGAAYDAGQYGAALNAAEKALKGKDEKAKADAQYVADLLNGRMEMHKAAAEAYRGRKELERLVPLLESSAREYSGLAYAKECDAEARKVKATKAYKDCVDARNELERLKLRRTLLKQDKYKAALEKIAKDYPETAAGREAAALAAEL